MAHPSPVRQIHLGLERLIQARSKMSLYAFSAAIAWFWLSFSGKWFYLKASFIYLSIKLRQWRQKDEKDGGKYTYRVGMIREKKSPKSLIGRAFTFNIQEKTSSGFSMHEKPLITCLRPWLLLQKRRNYNILPMAQLAAALMCFWQTLSHSTLFS